MSSRFTFPAKPTATPHHTPTRRFVFPKKQIIVPSRVLVGTPRHDGFPIKPIDNWISIDTETTGLDPWGTYGVDRNVWPARPFMFTIGNGDGETAVVRWAVDPLTREVIISQESYEILAPIFADPTVAKVFHNAPFDMNMIELSGFTLVGEIHDTQVGMHTINPAEPSFKLKKLCAKYLNITEEDLDALSDSVKAARRPIQAAIRRGEGQYSDWKIADEHFGDTFLGDEALCETYGRTDAYRTAALFLAVKEGLAEDPELANVYERERKLAIALRHMETTPTALDKGRIGECVKFYNEYKDKATVTIKAEVGNEFNPNSPKQMTAEFFGKRGYKPLEYSFNKEKKAFTKCMWCKGEGCTVCQNTGKNPKCNGDFLETIALTHETDEAGNDVVIEKDRLAHALLYESASETMLSYLKQYDEFSVFENGVWCIHPNYKQTGTKTARLSAEKPNLQNVASDDSGKKRVNMPYRSRECFVPRPGSIFYIPDYSQIEVWMLFLRAGATNAVNALAAGGDAHENVAQLIWGDLYDAPLAKRCANLPSTQLSDNEKRNLKIAKKIRKRAKNLQFCKIYGGGPPKIASMIGGECTTEEANVFIEQYEEKLPYVKQFMKDTIRKARLDGYIRNAYGRKYIIDREYAYRATNYDIQGSSADLLKSAMIDTHQLCMEKYLGRMGLRLTIHDELLIEADVGIHSQETMKNICDAMTNDYKFLGSPIRFPIGMKIADTRWSDNYEVKVA